MGIVLEAFYRDNYRIVYGYLLSLCADPDLAEDLAAEAFCKAIEHIKQYDPKYKASTWLCTIARNLFYSECRRKKRFVSLDGIIEGQSANPDVMDGICVGELRLFDIKS